MRSKYIWGIPVIFGIIALLAGHLLNGSEMSLGQPLPIPQVAFHFVPAWTPVFVAIHGGSAFQTLGANVSALLTSEGVYLTAGRGLIRIRFANANPESGPQGSTLLPMKMYYYVGNNPDRWQEDNTAYEEVRYPDLYPGIDLIYRINGGLKSSWVVRPGADPERIRVVWEGVSSLTLDPSGRLLITAVTGDTWCENPPEAYQILDGRHVPVKVAFHLVNEHSYRYEIASTWDPAAPLFIDPTLIYATFVGGADRDEGMAIAADDVGNTLVAGITFSMDFPSTAGPLGGNPQERNIFVAKIRPDGQIHYAMIIGGIGGERANAVGMDSSGNAYIAGETFSPDFPVRNAWQPFFAGYEDAFLMKLDSDGRLVYSTFLGGTEAEEIDDIYVDLVGNVYTAGEVYSDDFPLVDPWQSQTYGLEDEDAFISIFNAYGELVYSTYIGADKRDQIFRIALDKAGFIYATGMTSSPGFPLVHPLQSFYGGGWEDCFVLKFDPWNNRMIYSTFLGGMRRDEGGGIAVDESGNVYVAGRTSSPNFPLVRPWHSFYGDGMAENPEEGYDAFLAKINGRGDTLLFSTFIGGPLVDEAWGLALDGSGNVYLTGRTGSAQNFPIRNALQPSYGGGESDGFVLVTDPDGNLLYSSFVGGQGADSGQRLVLDKNGIVHLTGYTSSSNFPVRSPVQSYRGDKDGFIARMGLVPTPTPTPPFAVRTIGPEGGSLWIVYPGHLTLVKIPSGSIATSTTFTLTYDSRADFQGDLQGMNHFFQVNAEIPVTPALPWEVALGFTETRGVIPDTLALYHLGPNGWLTEGITVTEQMPGYLEAQIAQLGTYGLLGQTNRLFLPLILRNR